MRRKGFKHIEETKRKISIAGKGRKLSEEAKKKIGLALRIPLKDKFWNNVQRGKEDECWLWKGRTSKGYGIITHNYKTMRAHRISWELHYGCIPDGVHVLHKCDVPGCQNPNHLFLGNHNDNMKDKVSKGRQYVPCRNNHPQTKLTEEDVEKIKNLYLSGIKQIELADIYNVHKGTINRAILGKW